MNRPMKRKAHPGGAPARWPWQAACCVLLAFLLLYNPFAALHCSHSNNSVHNPQRNRATVGASEMQHFGVVQKQTQPTDLTKEGNREEVAAPARSYLARGFKREEVRQPDIAATVWSRPPPTR